MNKTRTWGLIFGSLLLLAAIFSTASLTRKSEGSFAVVYRDGRCIYAVDLSKVDEPYELTFSDESGYNRIRVERGKIAIVDADCPDRVCVDSGWLSDSALPIVCLPHRIVIRIEKKSPMPDDIDSVAG